MKDKFILRWFTNSKYLGMKKEHIKLFDSLYEVIKFKDYNNISNYEIYKQEK